jgi:hypothetical protein
MLVADFCMEPVHNLLMITPDSSYDVTAYYTTCAGTNPLDQPLTEAQQQVTDAQTATQAVLDNFCPGDQYLTDALVEMNQIQLIFGNMTSLLACQPTQDEALNVLHDGLCGDVFKGMWVIWLGMFVCGACLLIASIATALAYPYFAPSTEATTPMRPPDSPLGPRQELAPHQERRDEFYHHPGADAPPMYE